MKHTLFLTFLLIHLLSFSQISINDEYCMRRNKVLSSLDTSSVLVMKSIKDAEDRTEFYHDANFFYLTGINSNDYYLLMSPKGFRIGNKMKKTIIFYNYHHNEKEFELCDSDTLIESSDFQKYFKEILKNAKTLYYSAPTLQSIYDWINDKVYISEKEMKNKLQASFPNLTLKSSLRLIGLNRHIKSSLEISYIIKASKITADGIKNAMKTAKPGAWEYELQAAIECEYTKQGASGKGFSSIIGSGLNNLILHYNENNCQLKNGDLVVMDVGAKYKGYSTDITRTIPVNGKFTQAQKDIYTLVLNVQKEIISMLKPGVSFFQIEQKARILFDKEGFGNYLIHGICHTVGLNVHDVQFESTLKAGMVITIEPGLYFEKNNKQVPEKYRGFGIRIEDTILITENGYEILTKDAPKEIDEIEKIMKK